MAAQTIRNVAAADLDNYNPERFDARPNADGTYDLIPVLWWDEASYADYQGDRAELEAEAERDALAYEQDERSRGPGAR